MRKIDKRAGKVKKQASQAIRLHDELINLPIADNTPEAVQIYRAANERFRQVPWPAPFHRTRHAVRLGDARDLSFIPDRSVHLVVTSPPYWTLKDYPEADGQLGAIEGYDLFLDALDKAWLECERVLVPGGRICCVVGDICIPRREGGRHYIMPLHADIEVRARRLNLDTLTPIIWHKIANGVTEAEGNGAGFYGKPYQPGAIVKNDIEYILFLRKGGEYRSTTPLQKALSMLTKGEMQAWWRSVWTDMRGASTRMGHPAPYPVALAERLVKMFSFAGDTILDPFCGTGSTAIAAVSAGRNSISLDIERRYVALAQLNIEKAVGQRRTAGAIEAELVDELKEERNRA